VAITELAERTRQRLVALLADDTPDTRSLVRRLRDLRTLDGIPSFAATIHLLAHLEMADEVAEVLLCDILDHREKISRALARDPGLRVATIDYLTNIERRLVSPIILEMSTFEETERSAVTDSLTSLYNRRFFLLALDREIRRSRRYGLVFTLAMLDLDRFKHVNDSFGHLFGDLVLRRVARLIRRAIREPDVACRYGGEEFALILPETDRLGAHTVAERVRRRVEKAFAERTTGGREVRMTLSGGVAPYPTDGETLDDLVRRADESLYRAKDLGGNKIVIHHSERRAAVRYPTRPDARVTMARGETPSAVAVVPLNLSAAGALVETREAYLAAEPVRLVLGGGAAGGQRWEIPGRVVRVEPPAEPAQRFRVGVVFEAPLPQGCLASQVLREGPSSRAATGGSH
jgi:diguanylate cyclase (GGDEF)-like protein